MAKGGSREGAGRKTTWRSGPTKAIKLPVALCPQIVAHARRLDAGEAPVQDERIRQLEFRLEVARGDLRAARDDAQKAHDQRLREWGRANEAAAILMEAIAPAGGRRGATRAQVEAALDKMVPGWRTT